jgi:two-component system sensor histidine kinase/response regulator
MPIVAMTAHAMKGDEDRCLAAGMDAYLTKPFRTQDLLNIVEKFGNTSAGKEVTTMERSAESRTEAIDFAAALERLDGDRDLFEELAQIFKDECPKILGEMRRAFTEGDPHGLELQAHTLKGSSGNLNATAVSQKAAEIETLARSGKIEEAKQPMKLLEGEIERLLIAIDALVKKVPH